MAEGELLSIMGPSGSGKSTLMNIIGLLGRPTAGSYFLDGRDVSSMKDRELSAFRNMHIGFVFQSFNLLDHLTALENVAVPLVYRGLGRGEIRRRARAMLGKVGMEDRLGHKPDQLSGGQKQRVAIARALVGKPSVVLADEPTGALDSDTADEVMQLLIRLNREDRITILIITHDLLVSRLCERQTMIRGGALLLGCTDAHRCWSVDRRLGRIGGTTKVPLWNLLILQFQVEVILIFAGLVKIEIDWLRGEPLRTWMLERPWSPLSSLFEVHWITLAAPVLIILLHTVGAPLLLWSKTRLWVFLLYCAFHVTNAHLFNIGVFPWMTIAATTILFSPEWPTVLGRWIGTFLTWLRLPRPPVPAWIGHTARIVGGRPAAGEGGHAAFRPLHPAALAALVLYALVQIWLPVRDTLFEGYVGWTEEGQKFSWRMMLYVHGADGRLIAVTPEGEAWVIDMPAHLDPLQTWMVFAKPEMLLHFVQRMKAHYAEAGVEEVRIYADVVKNVNGQPYRRLIDPDVDLAAVDGMNWFAEDLWVLRPERMQTAEGLVPGWYPPITADRFSAMLHALGDAEPSPEGEAAAVREGQE